MLNSYLYCNLKKVKIRHYNIINKSKCFKTSECLQMTGKAGLKKTKNIERKILCKIMSLKTVNGQYRQHRREKSYHKTNYLWSKVQDG